jgi:hypothetical protein
MDAQGKLVRQVVDVIGDYQGSKAIKVEEPGIHVLNVIAEGDWSVRFD